MLYNLLFTNNHEIKKYICMLPVLQAKLVLEPTSPTSALYELIITYIQYIQIIDNVVYIYFTAVID